MNDPELKDRILEQFYLVIGEAKDQLHKEEIELLQDLAKDAAKITMKGVTDFEYQEKEMAFVNATLLNLSIAKYFDVKKVFWTAVQNAVNTALSVALSATIKLAKTAVIAATAL